jgi:hypothetical protein
LTHTRGISLSWFLSINIAGIKPLTPNYEALESIFKGLQVVQISIICALLHYFLDAPNIELIITYNKDYKK